MSGLRKEVRMFAEYMEFKLRENDHKPGWEHMDDKYLFRRLQEEIEELDNAIHKGNCVDTTLEAADIANFAMMIAWNANRRLMGEDITPDRVECSSCGVPEGELHKEFCQILKIQKALQNVSNTRHTESAKRGPVDDSGDVKETKSGGTQLQRGDDSPSHMQGAWLPRREGDEGCLGTRLRRDSDGGHSDTDKETDDKTGV